MADCDVKEGNDVVWNEVKSANSPSSSATVGISLLDRSPTAARINKR